MSRRILAVAATATLLVSACTSSGTGTPVPAPSNAQQPRPTATPQSAFSPSSPSVSSSAAPPTSSAPSTKVPAASSPASPASAGATLSLAQRDFNAMTEAQRVGQLFMVDCPSTSLAAATRTDITKYAIGSVILDGTSHLNRAQTAAITAGLQKLAPAGTKLFISTDQEGGLVQRLQGTGFTRIPSAVVQGTISPTTLQADVKAWATQLREAGVNVDLGPVMDTVPSNSKGNPPIGDLDREYGHTPATVTSHGTAVARGLAAAAVDATIKHFPGLGRVAGNTDTTAGVRDTVTTSTDPYLAPFQAAIKGGVPFVMMSTAIYTRIDASHPAAFSSTIVTGLLRKKFGFTGVIISDDLGQAKQVAAYSVGTRAIDFIAAGGDIVLTVKADQAAAMTAAVLARTKTSAAFKAQVDAAALTVLKAKQARGLLH
jgi:beta-N-acetylhexosaminidase